MSLYYTAPKVIRSTAVYLASKHHWNQTRESRTLSSVLGVLGLLKSFLELIQARHDCTYLQGWATSGFIRNSGLFFFYSRGKKTWARQVDYFFIGKKWRYDATLLQTCHSSRFNPDIPIFQYKSRGILISRFHLWKSHFFCFVSKLEKLKGVS